MADWDWWDCNVYVPSPFPAAPYPESLIAFLAPEDDEPDGDEETRD